MNPIYQFIILYFLCRSMIIIKFNTRQLYSIKKIVFLVSSLYAACCPFKSCEQVRYGGKGEKGIGLEDWEGEWLRIHSFSQ